MFWLQTACLLSSHRAHIGYGRQRQKPCRDPLCCAALAMPPACKGEVHVSTSSRVSLYHFSFSIQTPQVELASICISYFKLLLFFPNVSLCLPGLFRASGRLKLSLIQRGVTEASRAQRERRSLVSAAPSATQRLQPIPAHQ